jgi:hypothetical protein
MTFQMLLAGAHHLQRCSQRLVPAQYHNGLDKHDILILNRLELRVRSGLYSF